LGIWFDVRDEYPLFISRIAPAGKGTTAVQVYNEAAPQGLELRRWDYVKEVNGHSTADEMNSVLLSAPVLDLLIQRPLRFKRRVEKNGGKMGLDVSHSPGAVSLMITNVGDGAVRSSAPDIRAGDRIVSVNGFRGTEAALMDAISTSEEPVLGLARAR